MPTRLAAATLCYKRDLVCYKPRDPKKIKRTRKVDNPRYPVFISTPNSYRIRAKRKKLSKGALSINFLDWFGAGTLKPGREAEDFLNAIRSRHRIWGEKSTLLATKLLNVRLRRACYKAHLLCARRKRENLVILIIVYLIVILCSFYSDFMRRRREKFMI